MLEVRQIVQANVKALLKTKPGSRLKKATSMEVADGSLGRIVYGTGNPTLDVIEKIATYFKLEAWQLLAPDLGAALIKNFAAPRSPELMQLERQLSDSLQAVRNLSGSDAPPGFTRAQQRILQQHGKIESVEQLQLRNRQLAETVKSSSKATPRSKARETR